MIDDVTPIQWGEVFRHRDPSGVSGTGVVAQIVLFANKTVVVAWLGDHPCDHIWPSVDDFLAIHGHGGATVIYWNDGEIQEHSTMETPHCLASRPYNPPVGAPPHVGLAPPTVDRSHGRSTPGSSRAP